MRFASERWEADSEGLEIWLVGIEAHCLWVHWGGFDEHPEGLPAQRRQVMMVENQWVASVIENPALTQVHLWQPL